jgi:hypothetical protein
MHVKKPGHGPLEKTGPLYTRNVLEATGFIGYGELHTQINIELEYL